MRLCPRQPADISLIRRRSRPSGSRAGALRKTSRSKTERTGRDEHAWTPISGLELAESRNEFLPVRRVDRRRRPAWREHLRDLRAQIVDQQRRIDRGYASLVETMAATSMRLAEAARNADFSALPQPSGLGRTVEIRLAQTREISFRVEPAGGAGHGPSYAI